MYSDLTAHDQILLAIDFYLRNQTIPSELKAILGDEIIRDITNPVR